MFSKNVLRKKNVLVKGSVEKPNILSGGDKHLKVRAKPKKTLHFRYNFIQFSRKLGVSAPLVPMGAKALSSSQRLDWKSTKNDLFTDTLNTMARNIN